MKLPASSAGNSAKENNTHRYLALSYHILSDALFAPLCREIPLARETGCSDRES